MQKFKYQLLWPVSSIFIPCDTKVFSTDFSSKFKTRFKFFWISYYSTLFSSNSSLMFFVTPFIVKFTINSIVFYFCSFKFNFLGIFLHQKSSAFKVSISFHLLYLLKQLWFSPLSDVKVFVFFIIFKSSSKLNFQNYICNVICFTVNPTFEWTNKCVCS